MNIMVSATLVVGLMTTPVWGEELVANGSFEVGRPMPEGWFANSGNGYFGRITSVGAARTGQACAQVDSYSSHYAQYVARDVAVPTPGRYVAAAWVRLDGGFIQLRISGQGFHQTAPLRCYRGHPLAESFIGLDSFAGVSDTDWHCLQVVVEVPEGATSARVEVGFDFTPGRMWVDDVSLTPLEGEAPAAPGPEPSAAEFAQVRGDWQREWEAPRVARVGLPGARSGGGAAALPNEPVVTVTEGEKRAAYAGEVTTEATGEWAHSGWRVTVRNTSERERWLEVELAVPVRMQPDTRFWDGAEESPLAQLRRRDGPLFMLPLACVYDRQEGTALGLDPAQDLSHFAFETRRGEAGAQLACSARIVVEPGQTRTLDFVGYRFAPRWAWREAVQVYHDLFPEFARPTPGIDPRLLGTDGFAYGSVATRHLQMEECRRFATDWEWVYGQFQTPGDWYPDEQHWDPAKGYTGTSDLHHNEYPGMLDDYRAAARDRFQRGRFASAMLFYFVPQFCDQTMLADEYPDSWWVREDGSHLVNGRGYIKVGDDTAMAWPVGTSLGRATVEQMRQIAADFGPAGFAFDVAHGFQTYFGPAQEGLPGRAWSGARAFMLESIALGSLMDEVHRLRANGYTLGVSANGPYTHMVGRRSDVTMFEPPAFEWQHYSSRLWPVRLVTGGKPLYFHTGWGAVEGLLDVDKLDPEAAREAIAGAIDGELLTCLWTGGLPPGGDTRGVPKVRRWLPMLRELVRAGWQPVPAVEADGRLLVSRYGEGVGSFAALSNPTRERLTGTARVQTGYLGDGAYLLCEYDGSPIECVSRMGQTRLAYDLSPHEALVLRAPVAISSAKEVRGTVKYEPEALGRDELVAEFEARPGPAVVRVKLPEGARVIGMACNGADSRGRLRRGVLDLRVSLERRNRIVVAWEPALKMSVAVTAEKLLRLPLMRDGKSACAVITAPNAPEEERVAAERMASYVEYFLRRQAARGGHVWSLTGEPEELRPPMLTTADAVPEDFLAVLVVDPEEFGLTVAGVQPDTGLVRLVAWQGREALLVAGATPALTDAMMLRLLGLLDRTYRYDGALVDTALSRRAALAAKVLD